MKLTMIAVHLTPLEFDLAQHVAAQRNRDGIKASADAGKFGNVADTLAVHLRGVLGEVAVAKGLNRYWSGAGTDFYADDDVGCVQVRTTEHEHGCLLVRPDEGHETDPWVLVTGAYPSYVIRGWAYGHEARKEEYLRSPNGRPEAWFMPQSALRPLEARHVAAA